MDSSDADSGVGPTDPEIVFLDSADGLVPSQLDGLFAGWRRPVSAADALRVLRASQVVIVAVDRVANAVAGFVTALSDGVLCAHITFLEVRPEYRRRGIGRTLVRRLLNQLEGLYAIDAVCDPDLIPFYEACGMRAAVAVMRRHYESPPEGPKGRTD